MISIINKKLDKIYEAKVLVGGSKRGHSVQGSSGNPQPSPRRLMERRENRGFASVRLATDGKQNELLRRIHTQLPRHVESHLQPEDSNKAAKTLNWNMWETKMKDG